MNRARYFRPGSMASTANYSVDLIRTRRHFADHEKPETGHDWLSEVASSAPSADQLAFSGQVRGSIQNAMNELTAQDAPPSGLRHYEGLSVEEISAALGGGSGAPENTASFAPSVSFAAPLNHWWRSYE